MADDLPLIFVNNAIVAGRPARRSKNFIAGSQF